MYTRGNDWYDAPHFVMGDRHLYYLPEVYWQLDNRDQEVVGFSDLYDGGYKFDENFTGDINEINNNCYEWSNMDTVCFELVDDG